LGFKVSDRLQRVNGDEVAGMETLNQLLKKLALGQSVDVSVLRNGREQQLTLTLKEEF